MWRPTKRQILQIGGLGAAATAAGGGILAAVADGADSPPNRLSYKAIGATIPGTDISIPTVGLGTFQTFDALPDDARAQRAEVLRRFWAEGGRVIDTSPLYGTSEENIARHAVPAGIQDDIFLTNKIWSTGDHLWDESHALGSLSTSMRRLSRTKPIDVMQCHSLVNVEMIMPILHAWKAEGKIARVGVTHHDPSYFLPLANWVRTGDVDFVQTRYTVAERRAEEKRASRGHRTRRDGPGEHAVGEGAVAPTGRKPSSTGFFAGLGIRSWAQYFLKWVISHPAVAVALPATSIPDHVTDNMEAARGPLPDAAMRSRMLEHMTTIPGFDKVTGLPWYPDKRYPGVVNRDMSAIQSRTSWRPAGWI